MIFHFYQDKFLMKKPFVFFLSTFISIEAYAYEVKNVCAKYMTNYAWSQAYQVQTQIYTGQELNQATGNPYFGNYDMFSHYAVIWWQQGQASMIKLDFHVAGGMLLNSQGVDQNGHQWQLSDNSLGVCF